jgi:hypothetical protein
MPPYRNYPRLMCSFAGGANIADRDKHDPAITLGAEVVAAALGTFCLRPSAADQTLVFGHFVEHLLAPRS